MNSSYIHFHYQYTSFIPGLHYHIYKNSNNSSGEKLLLLHGSRLGGLETWDAIVRELRGWSEILVPDLPGVGALNPLNKTDHDFDLAALLQALVDLLDLCRWSNFAVLGYSFGGFLSMVLAQHLGTRILRHFNIESALLSDTVENLPVIGERLNSIAELMNSNPTFGNQRFSELVSSSNKRRFALKSNTRPIPNPLGFANLIKIMTKVYFSPEVVWSIINAQKSITTLLTMPATEGKLNMLACIQKIHPWKVATIENVDHSVVFNNPKAVAKKINEWFAIEY
jgi:pimeloyl-ACP methyl ester carboxylesterase